jgi:hypothetical protein
VTYGFLLCLGLLNCIYEYGPTTLRSPRANTRSNSSPIDKSSRIGSDQTSSFLHYLVSRFGSDRPTVLETFALAISVAAADFLSAYTLSYTPFEIFLFSRSIIISVSIVVTRYFATKEVVPSKAIFPAVLLCLGILIASYRPNLPQSPKAKWAAIFSGLFAAIWPFQLTRMLQSPGENSQTKYQRIGSGPRGSANGPDSSDNPTPLHLLQNTVFLAVVVLIPLLLFSGELGHISRNCYFLKVPNFWIFLFGGAAFRSVLLISSALFIQSTSALNFIILIVLIEVSQVAPLTYSKLLTSQWLALALCFLTAVWFYRLNCPSSTTSAAASDNSRNGEESRQSRTPLQKSLLQSVIRAAAVIILIAGCFQILIERGSQPILNEESPLSCSRDRPVLKALRGTDAYLGQRPHANTVANLSMLIGECRGTYENLENIYNVHRCLDFLSTKQDKYLSTPVQIASRLHGGVHDYTESDRSILDSNSIAGKCEGPIIPYHIWWTGLPTWRIELFIKSYFYTQNRACSKLWIWVNTDHHPGAMEAWLRYPRFQRFNLLVSRGDIILKEWKLPSRVPLPPHLDELDRARYYTHSGKPNAKGERLVADSIIRDSTNQEWVQIYKDGDEPQLTYYTVAVSDMARLIILHLHGGVYMDPDMLLLRDLRPLLLASRGFAERWGTSTDPAAYNNGFLYIPANSTISSYLLLGGTRTGLVYHFLALGRMLVQEGRDDKHIDDVRSLLKLENAFFDPMWVEIDGQRFGRCSVPCLARFEQLFRGPLVFGEWESFDGEPLEGSDRVWNGTVGDGNGPVTVNRTLDNFYRGAYTVHVHNLWSLQYEPGSWVDVMTSAHDGFFAGERTNAYGEQWEGPRIEGYLGGDDI